MILETLLSKLLTIERHLLPEKKVLGLDAETTELGQEPVTLQK